MVRRRRRHARADPAGLPPRPAFDEPHLHPGQSAAAPRRARPQAQVRPAIRLSRRADDERVGGRLDAAAAPRSEPSRAEAIRKFSAKDAETFLELSRQAAEWLPMIQAGLYSPPMPVGAQTAMMDQSAEGREIMRTMRHEHVRPDGRAVRARQGQGPLRPRRGREPGQPRREGDRDRRLRVPRLPREVRLRRAGRRLGPADRCADRLHRGPWRRGAEQRASARSRDRRHAARPAWCSTAASGCRAQRRRDRRDPSARAARDGAGASRRRREERLAHAHHRGRLLHRPRRARRAAQVQGRATCRP